MRGRGIPNLTGKYQSNPAGAPTQQPMSMMNPYQVQMPTCLRLLVSEASARAIVGAGGFELERIRNQMDGAINVDGDSGLAATVTFQSVKDHLLWAFGEIAPHLSLAPPPHVPHIPIKSDVIVNVLMPEHICGYFIGKAGVVIKKLSKEFGLFLKIESDVLPESNEKVLIIAGNYHKIDAMIDYVIEFYSQKLDSSSVRYHFTNYAQMMQNGTLMTAQNTSFQQANQQSYNPNSYDSAQVGSSLTSQNSSMSHNFMMTGYMGGSGAVPSNPSGSNVLAASSNLIQNQPSANSSAIINASAPKSEYNPYS